MSETDSALPCTADTTSPAPERRPEKLEKEKLEKEKLLMTQLPQLSLQILELIKSRGRITISEVVTLTESNRNTVKKHLEALVEKNYLQQSGVGKGTWYAIKI